MEKWVAKLHNRVQNGDVTALQTEPGGKYIGDYDNVDWKKFYVIYFKRLDGQLK